VLSLTEPDHEISYLYKKNKLKNRILETQKKQRLTKMSSLEYRVVYMFIQTIMMLIQNIFSTKRRDSDIVNMDNG